MNSELQKAINKLLKGDPSRVCPTCNDYLTAPGEANWEYCEACRRALHVHCGEKFSDGSLYCSGCAIERRTEEAIDASMEGLRSLLETLRPRVSELQGLAPAGEFTAILSSILSASRDALDAYQFPKCPNCGNHTETVILTYQGDTWIGCRDCMPRPRPAPPANPEVVSIRELTSSPSTMETPF